MSSQALPQRTENMEQHLAGKTALVTGASRGIGRTIALHLAAAGANVAINYQVNEEAAFETVAQIQSDGGNAMAVSGDVRDAAAVTSVVDETLSRFDSIHVLVNNAGITKDTLVLKMSEDDWDLVVDTNLRGAFLCTRAALRPMLAQRWGRIVNITSVGWLVGNPGQANYTAAKAGVVALTRSTAVEMGSRGITVNAIAPGYIPTDLTHDIPPHLMDRLMQKLPIKRAGTPEEIAALVGYLTSDSASYITGQVIHIDGGLTAGLL